MLGTLTNVGRPHGSAVRLQEILGAPSRNHLQHAWLRCDSSRRFTSGQDRLVINTAGGQKTWLVTIRSLGKDHIGNCVDQPKPVKLTGPKTSQHERLRGNDTAIRRSLEHESQPSWGFGFNHTD